MSGLRRCYVLDLMQHSNNNSTTAILLFAHSEEKEIAIKCIANKDERNHLLWRKMNERVLTTIQKTKLPFFISNEHNQIGVTFGDRLTNALRTVYEKGFENVIVIGNDCLTLQVKHLYEAENKLQSNDLVIGPDFNGGIYLLGITKFSFDSHKLSSIIWQTASVFNDLQKLFTEKKIAFLPKMNDCNTSQDFRVVANRLSFLDDLRGFIYSILSKAVSLHRYETIFSFLYSSESEYNKGSPYLI